jgi:DNA-binding PadR family transcriptional regulator
MGKGSFLGEFEQLVLLAIIRLEENAYGVTIRDTIDDYTGRDVIVGQVYAALERLEGKGFVRARISAPEPVPGGRARKLFNITATGRRALATSRQMAESMAEGLLIEPRAGHR